MTKEQWNFEKFILSYNRIALDTGGWKYEESRPESKLKEMFELSMDSSIEDFAKSMYLFEQKY